MYSVDERPQSMNGSDILFDIEPDIGNKISLKNGIQQKIYLDGEIRYLIK